MSRSPFAPHRLPPWLRGFAPTPVTLSGRERLRSCVGAFAGIACVGLLMRWLPGIPSSVPLLVAPMGASAVLLFAVPASPLAQPWSIIGGNLVAALVGVACARWIGDPVAAAALAVAVAIGAMFALRCVHPPSGAVALTAVLGGPAVHALGFRFVLEPIALQSAVLLCAALLYHALTGHRYPHAAAASRPAPAGAAFTRADLHAVLQRRTEWIDAAPDDLEALLRDVELQAYARTFSQLSCADIMSRPALGIAADTSAAAALKLLNRHRIKALPVLDAARRVIGIVTRADLSRSAAFGASGTPPGRPRADKRAAPAARDVMSRPVRTMPLTTPIAELVPLFADQGHHHIPIVDTEQRLAGIVTPADLITGLYRQAQLRPAA
ncbi:HPP family protein [Burkholderia sp. FERM BP-3421]|uniref:HPP family protein n=1 Tax=Burkholderia sp. FERM BP-3421 TaxID=1494466 RepID=UPI002361CCC2|nr:HPP family protein [Burkholderia sp. FERM BP-3421]WDD92144.1 HPP family protein [Burkholderia sp. FERM BP-3421]